MNHTCLILGHYFQDDWKIPYIPSYVSLIGDVYWYRCCNRCGEQESKNCATGEVINGKHPLPITFKYRGNI